MITITAQSMDELNKLYRKLKKHYRALDKIKIDQEGLIYRLDLEEKELKPLVKNQLEKVINYCDEISELTILNTDAFHSFLLENQKDLLVKQMLDLWNTLSSHDRDLVMEFLIEETELESTQPA